MKLCSIFCRERKNGTVQNYFCGDVIEEDIKLLRTLFKWFLITFPQDENVDTSRKRKFLKHLNIMNFYAIYFGIIEFRSSIVLPGSLGLSISLGSGTAIAIALRLYFCKQVNVAWISLNNSVQVLFKMQQFFYTSNRTKILLSFISCFALSCSFFSTYMMDPDLPNTLTFYVDYFFLGLQCKNSTLTTCRILYSMCAVMEFNEILLLYTFPGLILIFCCFQYALIMKMNEILIKRMKKSANVKGSLDEFLLFYSEITAAIKSTEKALSPIIFILYAYTLSVLFQVTTAIVTTLRRTDQRRFLLLVCSLLLFIAGIGSFISLSTITSRVHKSALNIRRSVYNLVSRKKSSKIDYRTLLLCFLMADSFPDQVLVTGWGFFSLDGGFALTAVGGIITYAVILAQFH